MIKQIYRNIIFCASSLDGLFGQAQQKSSNSGGGCFPIMAFLFLASISGYFFHAHYTNKVQPPSKVSLERKIACGSPSNKNSRWYRVYGNKETLAIVKSKYCQDAFLTSNGRAQIASFNSAKGAQDFARKLSQITGYKFWAK